MGVAHVPVSPTSTLHVGSGTIPDTHLGGFLVSGQNRPKTGPKTGTPI